MGAWDESDLEDEECSNCGAVYSVRYKKLPLKDDDSFTCSCGELMRSWKTTGMYMYTLLEDEE